ncbi:diacylglycerol kinase [Streptacidiphilus sp. P02-A3a]|nr:diacylglycerol kinase [Streptacidiphilus sp. P02-A3a]
MKAVVPEDLAELERVLSRKGHRRLVVIGDDQALRHVVQLLHRHAQLDAGPVGIIPVGKGHKVALARSLGAAGRPVDAARAVARGAERRLDLLVDEEGGVVLSGLRIPGRGVPEQDPGPTVAERGSARGSARPAEPAAEDPPSRQEPETDPHAACSPRANSSRSGRVPESPVGTWYTQLGRTARAAARSVAAPLRGHGHGLHGQFLRIEADGRLLADRDHPVGLISVWNAAAQECEPARPLRPGRDGPPPDGLMEVLVSGPAAQGGPYRCRAQRITVTGGLFTYEADHTISGPVRERTWTVEPGAWRLTVPPAA